MSPAKKDLKSALSKQTSSLQKTSTSTINELIKNEETADEEINKKKESTTVETKSSKTLQELYLFLQEEKEKMEHSLNSIQKALEEARDQFETKSAFEKWCKEIGIDPKVSNKLVRSRNTTIEVAMEMRSRLDQEEMPLYLL